jgi:hypothetical protein
MQLHNTSQDGSQTGAGLRVPLLWLLNTLAWKMLWIHSISNRGSLKKRAQPTAAGRARKKHLHELVTIVIVVIPIAIGVPPVAVFVPPTVSLPPAAFARLMQLVPRMLGLSAVPAVIFDGFVEFVVRLGNAALAMIIVFSGRPRCPRQCQHTQKRCGYEQGPSQELLLSGVKRHIFLHPPNFAPTGMGFAHEL